MANLYSTFITDLRADVGDFPINRYETADGDGATSRYALMNQKILESSLTVKVGGVAQVEGTDYTVDYNIAQILFKNGHIPASGNDTISFEYQSVNQLDGDWVNVINQVLSQLRKKFWIEVVDTTTLLSVVDQNDYALSGIAADVVHVLDFEFQLATNAPASPTADELVTNPWRSVASVSNIAFYKDLQKIHMRPAFNTSNFPLRVRLNRAYVQGTTAASTFEPQTRYWPMIKKFCEAIYLERLSMKTLKELTAVSKENTFENATNLRKLAIDVRNQALAMVREVRPPKPAKMIPFVIAGINI